MLIYHKDNLIIIKDNFDNLKTYQISQLYSIGFKKIEDDVLSLSTNKSEENLVNLINYLSKESINFELTQEANELYKRALNNIYALEEICQGNQE